jgi:carbamate kinase
MNNKIKNLVISVGGNALSNDPKKDAVLLEPIAKIIVNNVKNGINVLLTTGNGPQSGELFDIINDANKTNSKHLLMKLDEANAMSQGYIGFHVMKAIYNELLANNLENKYSINCLETLTIVDENDVA